MAFALSILMSLALASDPKAFYQVPPQLLFDEVTAQIHEHDKPEIAFSMDRKTTHQEGKVIVSNRFLMPSGEVWGTEEIVYDQGIPRTFVQNKPPEETKCELKHADGKIYFTRWEKGKVVREENEKFDDLTLIPDQIIAYIKQNWADLLKGETKKFRLTLPCRLETVGFKIFLDGEKTIDGKITYRFVMKPRSFIIAAIAPMIQFYFEKNPPFQMVQYVGHVLAKKAVSKDQYKDFEALMKITEIRSFERHTYEALPLTPAPTEGPGSPGSGAPPAKLQLKE